MKITIFSALADHNRLRIVKLLQGGALTVGEIATLLELRQPQVSKHLRVLFETGFVQVQADANRRYYHLCPEPFQEMDIWLSGYLKMWEERFERLDHYLERVQSKGIKSDEEE
ncbi:ArsR/SmtB family transcription factor [Shouchella lonarensis]|uniref:Transcriptional regulator, ArsR family n=1 Tax=Shouchella lonarensis TaxID=1464122 RepID=A0A1G6HXQ6_9BACI|nr:metalloregulator ArsR/SmtB family transcription factor [Shouchella lonarensis]SDB99001.1 transcriptional regulator, ArsR family [Shouchella lonarensis]